MFTKQICEWINTLVYPEVQEGTVRAGVFTWLDLNVCQGFEASPLPLLSLWNGPEEEADENVQDGSLKQTEHPGTKIKY